MISPPAERQIIRSGIVAIIVFIPLMGWLTHVVAHEAYPLPYDPSNNALSLFVFGTLLIFAISLATTIQQLSILNRAGSLREHEKRALAQPDRADALKPGETIWLQYTTMPLRALFPIILSPLILVSIGFFFSIFGEGIIFLASPDLTLWIVDGFFVDSVGWVFPTTVTLGEALVIVLPIVLSVMLAFEMIWGMFSGIHQRIEADDRGMTIRRWLRRRYFVAWGDIEAITRSSATKGRNITDGYTLEGRWSTLLLTLYLSGDENGGKSGHRYRADGVDYDVAARRLIATITHRANISLLRPDEADKPLDLTIAEANQLPLAHVTGLLQSPDQIGADNPLTLRLRKAARGWRTNAFEAMLMLAIFFLLIVFIPLMSGNGEDGFLLHKASSILIFLLFYVLFFGIVAFSQQHRLHLPIIQTTDEGIKAGHQDALDTLMKWEAIQAWVVVPPTAKQPDRVTYALLSDEQTITWIEPIDAELGGKVEGDRQLAYRETAERLHALIAASTGLALRELRQRQG